MLEPYSEEEREYIRYLLRKYLPSAYAEIEDTAVMFHEKKENVEKIEDT